MADHKIVYFHGIDNGDKAEQNESKIIRDKVCTHLKELVDKFREAGNNMSLLGLCPENYLTMKFFW